MAIGCDSSPNAAPANPAAAALQSTSQRASRYPPAPWRLLSWAERDAITLWVSHILIAHRESQPDMSLRPLGWAPDKPATRSFSEAQGLARRVAREALEHSERFEALARRYSDDSVTRAAGGSLGGVRASQLPEEFLDALTALRPGQVSEVIVTGMGYHVLLRRSPPPRQGLAGQHIVVRYKGSFPDRDEPPSERSHEQARALAEQLFEKARAGESFSALVAQYSEQADRVFEGDFGTWSSAAPGHRPREVETLASLELGEVARPIDSVWGFQVIKRIAPSARPPYAMAAIRFKVVPDAPPDNPRARDKVAHEAGTLARKLHDEPSAFTRSQEQYGSQGVESWEFGHGMAETTARLQELKFGEVAREPIRLPFVLLVAMRLDPALVNREEPPVVYELPARALPDLESVFQNARSAGLIPHLAKFGDPEILALLRLTTAEQQTLRSALQALDKNLKSANTSDARLQSYLTAQQSLATGMSSASYAKVMSFVQQEAGRIMLNGQ
jgi:hypothetical protein